MAGSRPPIGADQNGGRALQRVEQRVAAARPLLPVRKHIGGADIAGADLAEVAEARGAGQDRAERNGAEQIADDESEEIDSQRTEVASPRT